MGGQHKITEIELAKKNTEDIINFFKENPKYKGKHFRKRAIRTKFNLPTNRSQIVWEYLANNGFIINQFKIIIPEN